MAIKQIAYGIADYGKIIQKNMYYIDKTQFIHVLENAAEYLFFIRPRRFGKSLLLNLLQYYYDINNKDQFDDLFKDTFIGKNPTESKNSYLVMAFNFSAVNPSINEVESSFEEHVNSMINDFMVRYANYFNKEIADEIKAYSKIERKIQEIFMYCARNKLKVYLFIDEYDNFTNTILTTSGQNAYTKLTQGEGLFRYFFNLLKTLTSTQNSGLDKLFITGVSPITMDDVTSGFNIGINISLEPEFNEAVGFTEQEVMEMLEYYNDSGLLKYDIGLCMDIMKQWYNHYRFSEDASTDLFNSDMVLYFLRKTLNKTSLPKYLIDQNIKTDYGKLRFLVMLDKKLNGNFSRLKEIIEKNGISSKIVESFPVARLTHEENFISLLYYLGLLSIHDQYRGKALLKIPNYTIKELMYGYIRQAYEDVDIFKVNLWKLAEMITNMAYDGNWKPFFNYLSEQIELQTSIRDYLNGEKVIQGFLLAYLNVSDYFITQPEQEMNKGYSDIYLEPFIVKYPGVAFSYIIELKYIKRSEFSESKKNELVTDAEKQLVQYAQSERIKKTVGTTTLKKIVLIYNGWELVYCEEYGFKA